MDTKELPGDGDSNITPWKKQKWPDEFVPYRFTPCFSHKSCYRGGKGCETGSPPS